MKNYKTRVPFDDSPVAGLAMVSIFLFGLIKVGAITWNVDLYKSSFYSNQRLITESVVLLFSIALNVVFIGSILNRLTTISKQGNKLRRLAHGEGAFRQFLKFRFLLFMLFTTLTYAVLGNTNLDGYFLELPYVVKLNFSVVSLARYSFSLSITILFLAPFGSQKFKRRFPKLKLGAFPKPKNGLVIGSEVIDERESNWISISKRALNSNILITGSIGSGKTQSAVLPFVRQLTENMETRPSLLFIDPKRSMPDEVEAIVKENYSKKESTDDDESTNDFVKRITLGGKVTFNPIYCERMLKESNFIEVAQMVKAAAANYIGSGSKDKFWEEAAFNLIKNTLVLAYVRRSYFTLNDLYEEMVSTQDEQKIEVLEGALNNEKYDGEERGNIIFAANYFKGEYSSLDKKVKTSILVSASTFLNQFQEARASRIFCPKFENLDIKSMDSVIDEGYCVIVDIETAGLSRSMGTFIKLHFQKSVLDRLGDKSRNTDRPAIVLMDEYQDIVSVSGGSVIGDEKSLAKGREANIITIAATQSFSSLINSIGNDKAAKELIQNFRTKIAFHSSDLVTINHFKELVGQKDVKRFSRSVSEVSQNPSTNVLLGGMESQNGSVSESINQSVAKEYQLTGREFTDLKTFESIGLIYDGTTTKLKRINMKPDFLKNKSMSHAKVLKHLAGVFAAALLSISPSKQALAVMPNICSVVKTPAFSKCMDLKVGSCVCGFPIPRPCAKMDYYLPQSFIEVHTKRGETFFDALPLVKAQTSTLPKRLFQDGYVTQLNRSFFHAHTLAIPFSFFMLAGLPCGGQRMEKMCLDSMSEHIEKQWMRGTGDRAQPLFRAWALSPKACLIKGALTSAYGTFSPVPHPDSPVCSIPIPDIAQEIFPPSAHPQCTGQGFFFPRTGHVDGPASNTGAALVAARMKSLASEVFHSTPSFPLEKFQQILPHATDCFREGQNFAILEAKQVTEKGRVMGGPHRGYLTAVWKKDSCCKDLNAPIQMQLMLQVLKQMCQVAGA